jgi:hypothetical protein
VKIIFSTRPKDVGGLLMDLSALFGTIWRQLAIAGFADVWTRMGKDIPTTMRVSCAVNFAAMNRDEAGI